MAFLDSDAFHPTDLKESFPLVLLGCSQPADGAAASTFREI